MAVEKSFLIMQLRSARWGPLTGMVVWENLFNFQLDMEELSLIWNNQKTPINLGT